MNRSVRRHAVLDKAGAKPRVLMIAPVCYPPAQPEAIVNAKLALAMMDARWEVDVVSQANPAFEWYPAGGDVWAEVAGRVHLVAEFGRTARRRIGAACASLRACGQVSGGVRWAVPAYRRALQLVRERPHDVILSRAVPDHAHLAALMVARRTSIPWIANWNDPQPSQRFPAPYGAGPSAPMPAWQRRFYGAISRQCRWHTFACARLQRYMCQYLGPKVLERSSVVPHVALERFRSEPRSHEGFIICHAGSLRSPRSPRVLLEAASLFRSRAAAAGGLRLRFIVDDARAVNEEARRIGVEDIVEIAPTRPYGAMPEALAESDVVVIVEAAMEEGIFLPSKFVDYIQSGRPILALSPLRGTIRDLMGGGRGGLVVDGTSATEVAEAIEQLYVRWMEGDLESRFGSESLFEEFSERKVLSLLTEIFEAIGIRLTHAVKTNARASS